MPGHKAGPGNPFGGKVEEFRQLLIKCVSKKDFKAVMESLIHQASHGNVKAQELFLNRLIGKVKDQIGLDIGDLRDQGIRIEVSVRDDKGEAK